MTDYRNTVLYGDARQVLPELIEAGVRVNEIVCSPPYYGLRDYGVVGQIGLETRIDEYVEELVGVFRLCRELLVDDGIFFLNLGDSYAGSGGAHKEDHANPGISNSFKRSGVPHWGDLGQPGNYLAPKGMKPKDLVGVPWQVAFALRDDGWYLRQWLPWIKRNPMPESVADRPSSAVEIVFLFSKSEKCFFDMEAVKRAGSQNKPWKITPGCGTKYKNLNGNKSETLGIPASPSGRHWRNSDPFFESWQGLYEEDGNPLAFIVNTQGYPGSHFAVFPPKLVAPMIKAGTSERGHCPSCGAGWKRIIEKGQPDEEHKRICGADSSGEYHGESQKDYLNAKAQDASATKARILEGMVTRRTVGWEPSCKCGLEPAPALVLDPFAGSGTTLMVAEKLGRHWLGIELNEAYAPLIRQRTAQIGLGI